MSFFKDQKIRKALGLIFLSFLAALFFISQSTVATSWSLLPPLLAIFIAFVSGHLSLSLGSAVLMGGFLLSYGESGQVLTSSGVALQKTSQYFLSAVTDTTNLQILGFVFFILSMVHVMTVSGGLHALVRLLQRFIVGPRSAQFITFLLGCLIFIDDYANTMIVGSTMKKVTDRHHVSREKLAFLVDSTSAPIAGVALVSTWIGYEVGLFSEMSQKFSWPLDGYAVFLDAIQFRFYCFFMLFFVFINIIFGVDFGPMKDHQKSPIDSEEDLQGDEGQDGHWLSSVLPLALLLTLVFTLLWHDGGGFSPEKSVLSLTDWRQVLTASQNGIWILFISSIICYFTAIFLALVLSRQSFASLGKAFMAGVKSAWLPIMILVLAWSLKEVCDELQTGPFIVSALSERVSPLWLPMAIFIISALTAFSTGTSWGTMAILIPTVTPLAVAVSGGEYGVFVSLCLAAILDGAIMGDHCSPISDTTIMSCISTDCDLLNHVKTQLPYSLIVGSLALIFGYLPAGMQFSLWITVPVSMFLIVSLFAVLKNKTIRRKAL